MKKKLILIFAGALLFRLILSLVVWHPDINSNADWGIRFWQYGPAKFFAPETNVWNFTWPNQPPGTIYMFAAIRKLFEVLFYGVFSYAHFQLHIFPGRWLLFLESNLYSGLLKLPSILADLGIAYIIYKVVGDGKGTRKAVFGAVLWLVNPVIWYNSAVWGQTDAVINFLALLAFYLLLQKKLTLSLLFLVLSFYIKASLLIFIPIYLIVVWRQRYKLSEIAIALVCSLLVIGAVTLPFSQGEPFSWLLGLYQHKVFGQQLQIITANAFNIWATITSINEQPQILPFLGLTYQYWGYILFGISFVPILYSVCKNQKSMNVIWALALTSFSSWMFLTNMHERYLYPLFPYLTILVAVNLVSLYPYILISLVSLLNLYNFWWVPKIDFVVNFLSFGERLMPRILGIVNLSLLFYIYRLFFKEQRVRILRFIK